MIVFTFEGKKYTAPDSFFESGVVKLPDGRFLRAAGFLETSPPQPVELEITKKGKGAVDAIEADGGQLLGAGDVAPDGEPAVVKANLAQLKAAWEDAARAIGEAQNEQDALGHAIAADLAARGKGKKARPTITLGTSRYKVSTPRDANEKPRLVKLVELEEVDAA